MTGQVIFINYSDANDVHDYRHKQKVLSHVGKYLRNRGTPQARQRLATTTSGKLGRQPVISEPVTPSVKQGSVELTIRPQQAELAPANPPMADLDQPQQPQKCISAVGPCVRSISELDGRILHLWPSASSWANCIGELFRHIDSFPLYRRLYKWHYVKMFYYSKV